MLILNMILRITKFTQEGLANYIGVSRASINSWLTNDQSMSESSKRLICQKFQIPYNYFQIDLNQNIEYYKLVYSTIYENWSRINANRDKDDSVSSKIDEILNKIDSDLTPTLYEEIGDMEILEGLANGYNPFTGEILDKNDILNNPNVKETLQKLLKCYVNGSFGLTKEDLNDDQLKLFEELRSWRMNKTIDEGYYHAYMVFNDSELINIITADIEKKEDLLNVKGIGTIKYNKYGNDVYNILKSHNSNKLECSDVI